MASKVFTSFFYDLTYWPSFWPRNIHTWTWPSLMKISQKLWSLESSPSFFYDLTYWPSFWPRKIHIWTWPSLIKIGSKLWPLWCSQGFSMFWPTDLLLTRDDPYSILTKFDKDWTKTVAPRVFKRFFYDLTYWPSFWPGMIHIQSWLSLIKIGPKLWPLECSQGFSMVWPTDLVFDPGWSIFDLDPVWWRLAKKYGL